MKPEFKIYVNNPAQLTPTEKELSKSFTKLIKERYDASRSMQSQDGLTYVGIFFNRNEIPEDFIQLTPRLFYKDFFAKKPTDWLPFEITLKAGLKQINCLDIKNVAIAFSDSKFEEEDLFAVNRKSSDAPTFVAIPPIYSLDDVIMNDNERESILRALAIVSEKSLIFDKWGFSNIDKNTKSILCFHGAAGTGKTMCAHAVAKYLGKNILIGSYSQIQSKFVGEGEKNLVAYFKAAEEQDAVLFIDEADTFLSRRLPSSNENSKHYNSMSNELYTLIENFNGCIVFASNHIKDFDPAVISRIIEPVEFKLPDDKARRQIIMKMLPDVAPIHLEKEELDNLVSISKGFSGRDIRKAILILFSSSAYKYKIKGELKDDEIRMQYDDILAAFNHVKKNKIELDRSVNGINVNSRIVESSKKNLRIMQMAAQALWADGIIHEKEKRLFDELSSKFGVDLDINDKENIPPIETICNTILSKTEKVQMLDIACRMVAIDGDYSDTEKTFISKLCSILGVKNVVEIDNYIHLLMKEYTDWKSIVDTIGASEYDMLCELRKELSEAASWYKLSRFYSDGTSLNGHIILKNPERAKECLEKASQLGYEKATIELHQQK